jgi:hypothetical protein
MFAVGQIVRLMLIRRQLNIERRKDN